MNISDSDWQTLDPALASHLVDARHQLHHAAQFAAALGISFLRKQPDDSHTNMGWLHRHRALVSHAASAGSDRIQVGVRPGDLTLLVLRNDETRHELGVAGHTVTEIGTKLREVLTSEGLDGKRFTLDRHYDLPPQPLDHGAKFDTQDSKAFRELEAWYANAAGVLRQLRARLGSSEVRCWPHHFDIATLATIRPGRTSGAGLSPGDESYGEPYFYVNAYPSLASAPTPDLGGGRWHSEGWSGAVLRGSQLPDDANGQFRRVAEFLDSSTAAIGKLLAG
jgi:hypothetical protein